MTIIRINLAEYAVSESAKAPAYKVSKINGVTTLVVNSAKKGELQAVVGHLKKAKASAIAGITAAIKANTAATKAHQLPAGDKRKALMATRKEEKAKSSAEIKSAKAELREANKVAKAHGLGGLNMPLSSDDIKTGVGSAQALKDIRSAKLTEFGVTGKRGVFKPKFLKEEAFNAVGTKASKTATKTAPKAVPVKNAKAVKTVEVSVPTTPAEKAEVINSTLASTLKKLGYISNNAQIKTKSGELLDKMNKYDKMDIINKIRDDFEEKGLETKPLKNGGFVVPGMFQVNNSNYFGIEFAQLKGMINAKKK